MLFIELYSASYKTSSGQIEGWILRFFSVESVADLQEKFDQGDTTWDFELDDDYVDMEDRDDLDWYDQSFSGAATWFVADPAGMDDMPAFEIIDALISGEKTAPTAVTDALADCNGCFTQKEGYPAVW